MLSTLLFVALLAIQVTAGSLPHVGKYAQVVEPRTVSNTTYNFIIAGGGIGGLTVADRLTEDPNSKLSVIWWKGGAHSCYSIRACDRIWVH